MKVKKLQREDNRIIGGICSGISKKYDSNILVIRIVFLIASWSLAGLPILIYLILWISIPSRNQTKKKERERKYLMQSIGLITGAIIGGFVGFSSDPGQGSGSGYKIAFYILLGVPIGSLIGFSVIRSYYKTIS